MKPAKKEPPFDLYVVNVRLRERQIPIAYTLYLDSAGERHSNWWVHNTDGADPELTKIEDTLSEVEQLIVLEAVTVDSNVDGDPIQRAT